MENGELGIGNNNYIHGHRNRVFYENTAFGPLILVKNPVSGFPCVSHKLFSVNVVLMGVNLSVVPEGLN